MAGEPDTEPGIRTGPRWEAVVAAIATAEEVLDVEDASEGRTDEVSGDGGRAPEPPDAALDEGGGTDDADDLDEDGPDDDDLDADLEDEGDDGQLAAWSKEERGVVLDAVARVRDELAEGVDTAVVLAGWRDVDADALDAAVTTPETEAVLDLDLALSDLERAEAALTEATRLDRALVEPITPSDRDDGFDEAVRDDLVGLIAEIRGVLASGAMLSAGLMDRWADALRGLGYRRTVERPGVDDDAQAVGFTRRRIEQFPPGRRYEPVAIFDGWLYNIGFTDTMDEEDAPSGALDEAEAPVEG